MTRRSTRRRRKEKKCGNGVVRTFVNKAERRGLESVSRWVVFTTFSLFLGSLSHDSVSYTHLDVYKRQELHYLLEQVEEVNKKPLIQAEVTPIKTSPIQLEPIKLPCFSSNIIDWQHYYNMFLELVHVRTDLTDIQKLRCV